MFDPPELLLIVIDLLRVRASCLCVHSGDEDALNRLAAQPETLSRVNELGWIPLHEAAVWENKGILEILFSGSRVIMSVMFDPFKSALMVGCLGCSIPPRGSPVSYSEGRDAAVPGGGPWTQGERHLPATERLQPGSPERRAGFSVGGGSVTPVNRMSNHLHMLVFTRVSSSSAILNDQYDLATLLLRYDASVDLTGPLNRTALHESAFLGLENFVYLLLESGADPNTFDIRNKTPLALAAQNGHLNVVEVLLQKGELLL